MHRLRYSSCVIRFRLSAFLMLANFLLAAIAAGMLIHSMIIESRPLAMAGIALMTFCMLLVIVQWMAASLAACPLCHTAVLAPKSCMKHRRARTLLGSHRLRVASSVIFRNRFRCPYCNEFTTMELRETFQRPSYQSSQVD